MWNIWMRNYPQADINVTEEWDIPALASLNAANSLIEELEDHYNDDGWKGNRLYKAKFYAAEA